MNNIKNKKQESENKNQLSIEARVALLEFNEKESENKKKIVNLKKNKIYAIISYAITLILANIIFTSLNWPEDAMEKIFGIESLGLSIVLFSESIGKYIGTMWFPGRIGTNITEESPPSILRLLGWIFIFLPITIALFSLVDKYR